MPGKSTESAIETIFGRDFASKIHRRPVSPKCAQLGLKGAQVCLRNFSARAPLVPKAIQEICPKSQQRRAGDAWRATNRLSSLIWLWQQLMLLGSLRSRLDEPSEQTLIARFPSLNAMGGVLNRYAQDAQDRAEFLEDQSDIDAWSPIKRGPTSQHRDDDKKQFGWRTVLHLREEFRRQMLTDADCLYRLDLNKELFQRPWPELRALVSSVTAFDISLEEELQPSFPKTHNSARLLTIRDYLTQELKELAALLQEYPETALERTTSVATASSKTSRRVTLSNADANIKVREYLSRRPNAKSPEIARALGCSQGLVRTTAAWKAVSEQRRSRPTSGRHRGSYEKACEEAAVKVYIGNRPLEPAEQAENRSRTEELQQLIAEQENDQKADARRRARNQRLR